MSRASEKRIFTIPNILSVLRIFLLIPFAIYYSNEEYLIAMIILVVSGITDIVDGFIARHFNMITTVGKVLDPLADKITQVSVAICIAFNNTFIMPTLIIFCIKELLMLIGSFVLLRKGLRPSESKWWGKVGTVVIYAYLIMVLVSDILPITIPDYAFLTASIIAISTMLYSLFSYGSIFSDVLNGKYDFEKESHNSDEKLEE